MAAEPFIRTPEGDSPSHQCETEAIGGEEAQRSAADRGRDGALNSPTKDPRHPAERRSSQCQDELGAHRACAGPDFNLLSKCAARAPVQGGR